MKAVQIYLLLHSILTASVLVHTFNSFGNYYNPDESCDSEWISFNAEGLKADLESKLFGQHIASRIILKSVNGFMSNDNPEEPLVLSLHGTTGTGKNFVSQLIAENIYKEGMESKFVHIVTAKLHFPDESKIETYKTRLQKWFKGSVTNCGRSMFIFDEMDEMHSDLIESIRPYLDSYNELDGVSYRKAIFIFLSNTGGNDISQTALDFWDKGRGREEIELRDLEMSLSTSAFNDNSGLWQSGLISKYLVNFFIPFLPLEYRHVIQCVIAEMKARRLRPDQNVANQLAKDLVYFPKDREERVFSIRGCKTIRSRLDYYV